jgi:hypothetical protein
MKNIMFFVACLIMAIPSANAAQLYRWVDGKGQVEWRDTPPPPTAKNVQTRIIKSSAAPAPDQPYSVQLAAKNFPVTLWATDCGNACTSARTHLAKRGVPHTIKNPQADFEQFKKTTGGAEVPFMQVGNTKVKGYQEKAYDNALDFAGYPKTALVPMKPQPIPAVPTPKPATKGKEAKPAGGTQATSAPTQQAEGAAAAPATPPQPSDAVINVPTIR